MLPREVRARRPACVRASSSSNPTDRKNPEAFVRSLSPTPTDRFLPSFLPPLRSCRFYHGSTTDLAANQAANAFAGGAAALAALGAGGFGGFNALQRAVSVPVNGASFANGFGDAAAGSRHSFDGSSGFNINAVGFDPATAAAAMLQSQQQAAAAAAMLFRASQNGAGGANPLAALLAAQAQAGPGGLNGSPTGGLNPDGSPSRHGVDANNGAINGISPDAMATLLAMQQQQLQLQRPRRGSPPRAPSTSPPRGPLPPSDQPAPAPAPAGMLSRSLMFSEQYPEERNGGLGRRHSVDVNGRVGRANPYVSELDAVSSAFNTIDLGLGNSTSVGKSPLGPGGANGVVGGGSPNGFGAANGSSSLWGGFDGGASPLGGASRRASLDVRATPASSRLSLDGGLWEDKSGILSSPKRSIDGRSNGVNIAAPSSLSNGSGIVGSLGAESADAKRDSTYSLF